MAFLPERNFLEEILVTNYSLSGGVASWSSSEVSKYNSFSIQVVYSSTAGINELLLEQSNDGTSWDEIDNSIIALPVGSGSVTLDRSVFTGKYLRLRLTAVSSGLITIKTMFKR